MTRESRVGTSCTRDCYERENKEEKISGVFRGWSRVGTDEERWPYLGCKGGKRTDDARALTKETGGIVVQWCRDS